MAYPTLPQMASSAETQMQGRQLDRATNGTPRVRSFYPAMKKVFDVKHEYLTGSQKTTLESFFSTNLLNSFTFVWSGDGVTYTVVFGVTDLQWMPLAGSYWNVALQLVQV